MANVVDRSSIVHKGMDAWGFDSEKLPRPEWEVTASALREMGQLTFGHIAYLPEYAEAVQAQPTKVLFNARDPRDVVVAEYEHIKTMIARSSRPHAWLNYRRESDGKRVIDLLDPLAEIIRIDAHKWRNWIGWLDHDFTVMVRFEDLRMRPNTTVDKLIEELEGCSLPMRDMMVRKTRPAPKSPSFRLGRVGEWKRYFSPHHIKLADELLGPIITRLGYRMAND